VPPAPRRLRIASTLLLSDATPLRSAGPNGV